ncbi:MAG TPA: hypothetical protein EYN92_07095 [Dehalococcoidia bacterium]|nr:hypothetical protein [Dehalococcoidia bacterium]
MKERSITINAGNLSIDATLNETEMAEQIWNSLPLSGAANIWGDEIYFDIPVSATEHSEASDLVSSGDIAFWPPGNAFCIFFGRTPASTDDKPRAASAVNVFGHISGDEKLFRGVNGGTEISIVVKG